MKKKVILILMFLVGVLTYSLNMDLLKVNEINIKNTKEIPNEVLTNMMKLKKGQLYKTSLMVEDYTKIKLASYVKDVKIYPEVVKNGINLIVLIDEENNAKQLLKDSGIIPMSEREKFDKTLIIKNITVSGNDYIPDKEILSKINIQVGGYLSKERIKKSVKLIKEMGYFAEVTPEVLTLNDGVYISYSVTEFPALTGVVVKGNSLFTQEELTKDFKTKVDYPYNINFLKDDKKSLLKTYWDKGYALANLTAMYIDNQGQLIIEVSEGIIREIKYRKIIKQEQGFRRNFADMELKTKKYILDREVILELNKPFELDKFNKSASNIFRMGFFGGVSKEVKSIPNDPQGKILIFLLDENRTSSYKGTVSYGSADGLVGSVGVEAKNFRGKAQNLSFNVSMGTEDSSKIYSVSFYDPWVRGTDKFSYGWSIYRSEYEDELNYNDYDIMKHGFRVSIGKTLYENWKSELKSSWRLSTSAKYEQVEEDPTEVGKGIYDEYETVSLIPALTYDRRNSYYNATRGEYAKLSVELGQVLDRDFYHIWELELRKYHAGFSEKNTFAYRILTGVASDTVRESQKLSAGGGNTLRGYESSEFSGIYRFVANIENRTNLGNKIDFVTFYDIGRAWDPGANNKDDIELGDDFKQSYGIGLRIQTPIGPLRFDYGWPINSDNEEKGGKFYFNMGHLF